MALIHDDIIDKADKRHNAMTVHKFIETLLPDQQNRSETAQGQAILIGDLLLARTNELLFDIIPSMGERAGEAVKQIHTMIEEVILGQMLDVNMTTYHNASLDLIDKKNTYKTASYTFVRPMLTGAILAGADQETQNKIADLGLHLGLVFQIRDDLMDITGGDKTKSAFSDIQEGQQSYFTHYIHNQGNEEQKCTLENFLGKKVEEKDIPVLQEIFESSGAITRGKEQINEHLNKAKIIFESIPLINLEAKESFARMIRKMER